MQAFAKEQRRPGKEHSGKVSPGKVSPGKASPGKEHNGNNNGGRREVVLCLGDKDRRHSDLEPWLGSRCAVTWPDVAHDGIVQFFQSVRSSA